MTKEDPDNWDKQIPTVLMGYRATRQASTKYSPFFMLHGHDMVSPVGNTGRTVSAQHGEQSESFLADLFGPSEAVLAQAHANIIKAQEKQSKAYANRQLHGTSQSKPDSSGPVADALKDTPVVVPVPTVLPTVDTPLTAEAKVQTSTDKAPVPIKQEENTAAGNTNKKRSKIEINEGDFIVAKIHKLVRTQGSRKGKLVPKAEGPYLVTGFTDESKQIAIIADANGVSWRKRVADLSLWE
ncbi:TPA: hypothetical protein ACH3X2_004265 [Trebouxia sp. C0005]